MQSIAERAGVAVQTVYFSFRTKGLLFLDVLVRLGHPQAKSALEKPVPPFAAALPDEQDPQRFLALAIDQSHDFYLRFAPLLPFVQIASEGDPEFQKRFQSILERRLTGMHGMFKLLDARGALRVPAEDAAQTYFLVSNPELITLSTSTLGWSNERYKAWTWQVCVTQLLRDDKPRVNAIRDIGFSAQVSLSEQGR